MELRFNTNMKLPGSHYVGKQEIVTDLGKYRGEEGLMILLSYQKEAE